MQLFLFGYTRNHLITSITICITLIAVNKIAKEAIDHAKTISRYDSSIGESMESDRDVKKVQVTLPDSIAEDLQRWAEQDSRPLANLCAFLLENSVREAKASGELKDSKSK